MRLKILLQFWRERCVYLSRSPPQLPHCAEPDGRHAGIPFVVGARRVFSAVAGTDQDVHSYVFMLQVDKHERCSLEVLLAMPDWASISGDGSVHQQSRWRTLTSALDLLTPGADKDQQDMVRFGVVRKFPNAKGEDQGPIWHTIDYAFGKDQHNAYNNECCRMLALHRGNMGPGGDSSGQTTLGSRRVRTAGAQRTSCTAYLVRSTCAAEQCHSFGPLRTMQ